MANGCSPGLVSEVLAPFGASEGVCCKPVVSVGPLPFPPAFVWESLASLRRGLICCDDGIPDGTA